MPQTLDCPSCGAPLDARGSGATLHCPYCGAEIAVPEDLLSAMEVPEGARLSGEKVHEILDAVRAKQKVQAVKVLRAETGLAQKEAKDTVDSVERLFNNPAGEFPGEAEALIHQVAIAGSQPPASKPEEPPAAPRPFWTAAAILIALLVLVILVLAILLK
ncbi:MAG TPA: ribosomal protein L7/L12 [Anaerolineaceae bacterium]